MTKTLPELVGRLVRLTNVAQDIGDYEKLHYQIIGVLQADGVDYTVNGGDHPSGHGLQTIGFQPKHVDCIERGSSGIWLICLK